MSFHLAEDRAAQSARLQLALQCLQIIALSVGVLEIAIGLNSASKAIVFFGLESFGVGMLTVLAKKLVSAGRLALAVSLLCTSFFAATIGTVCVMPGALPLLVLVPILAIAFALPYLSSRALRGITIAAWLVTLLAVALAQLVTPLEPPTAFATNAVVGVGVAAIGPILLLLLWQFHNRLTEALAHALAANASLHTAMAEAQAARIAAEQANELKTQFLANMSHELRTPLNSIINFTRILSAGMRGPVTSEQRDYLARVRQSGEHLLGLINDILDLSKIESGRMDLYTEPVQLAELIQGVMATAAGLTKDKPIVLRQELAADLPLVAADRTRLRQILLNLLSNAAKFTSSGTITVRAHQQGDQVVLSVSDTGIGIAAEHLTTIFEEFRQLEGSANRRYEGTGLGLAICRRLVQLHGGDLWVESMPEVGSTFAFSLPSVARAPEQQVCATLASSSSTGIPVLVVDDDPTTIEIVAAYLEHEGYAVYGLADSRRVLAEALMLRPAAIILDVLMPHKDGWEVLAELKNEPQLQAVPIVLYTIIEEQKLGFYLGASAYLTKPIDADQLRTTLGRLVGHNATVLVIDDDPNACEIVSAQLGAAGSYQVVTASGGRAGLAQVAAAAPDLIILDLMMPEVDGFAVLAALDQQAETRAIPVIVLTAKQLNAGERAALEQRVRGLLHKGSTPPAQLLGRVRALLATTRPLPATVHIKE
jgi:signal transduction histidine kinase/CheY-like chemotaxis protein